MLPAPFEATPAHLLTFSQDRSAPSLGLAPTLRMAPLHSPTATLWLSRTRQSTLHRPNSRPGSVKRSSPACPSLILACRSRQERRWIVLCCGTKRTLKRKFDARSSESSRVAEVNLGVRLFTATTFCTSPTQHWRRCSTRRWRTGASSAYSTPPCSALSSSSWSASSLGKSASGPRRHRSSS